ncbi:MAG: hypothetical protein HY754_13060 [Nitrospirae bacterium]|nr:hypothetical protein [Nitrospirota bacterium]
MILEIFIAGLILTSSIAAAMYLFKMGFEYLQKANDSNVISSRLPDAVNLIKIIDLEQKSGIESLSDDVTLKWESRLVEKGIPVYQTPEGPIQSLHELYLYKVNLRLDYKTTQREYEINVFKYKTPVSTSSVS